MIRIRNSNRDIGRDMFAFFFFLLARPAPNVGAQRKRPEANKKGLPVHWPLQLPRDRSSWSTREINCKNRYHAAPRRFLIAKRRMITKYPSYQETGGQEDVIQTRQ